MSPLTCALCYAADKTELALTYAALILHDDGHQVTAEKLEKLLKGANISVEPYWPSLFERVLKDRNLDDLILSAGAAPAAAAPTAAAAATGAAPAAAAKEEKKKEEEKKEESDQVRRRIWRIWPRNILPNYSHSVFSLHRIWVSVCSTKNCIISLRVILRNLSPFGPVKWCQRQKKSSFFVSVVFS